MNNGLSLSKNKHYECIFPNHNNIYSFNWHVMPFPGLFLRINKLIMYSGGNIINITDKDSLFLTTSTSFISDDGAIMLFRGSKDIPSSTNQPEIININVDNIDLKQFYDKIVLHMDYYKANLTSPNICS